MLLVGKGLFRLHRQDKCWVLHPRMRCNSFFYTAQRVQVPNNHILTQNLYQSHYYPNPKYLIIEYMDPLGCSTRKFPKLRELEVMQNFSSQPLPPWRYTIRKLLPLCLSNITESGISTRFRAWQPKNARFSMVVTELETLIVSKALHP